MRIWHLILIVAVIVAAYFVWKHRASITSKLGV